ncbi:alpha/beta-hydrolase [Hypoxylon fuscum]|nr:alpha/beta-hydrolase [Hypoxylon fuscum]
MVSLPLPQPFKGIYALFFALKLPFQIASLLIYYVPVSFRPIPQWSLRTCVVTSALRSFFSYIEITGTQGSQPPTPEKAKERLVIAEPAEDDLYSSVLSSTAIKPVSLRGLWDSNPSSKGDVDKPKVVLHFPGGGFTYAYDAYESSQGVSQIMERMRGTRTLFAQYRLATASNGRFPAAIQDALTFYNHVLKSGVDPKNIIFLGDSAGGHVVLALLRHLECSQELPLPAGVMLWSPWVNITDNVIGQYSDSSNLGIDYVVPRILEVGAKRYIPEGGITPGIEPFLSPLRHPFKTSVPLFVHAGTAELFYDEIKSFADAMSSLQGNTVRFHSTAFAPHDILLSHKAVGFTAQAIAAMDDAANFFSGEAN